jgi:tetratricopeptide (TPR) repeat protein
MRRRLNLKVLAGLLLVGVAVAVALYLVHGLQVRRHAAALLAEADLAEEQDDPVRLQRCLARYLALVPADRDALCRYGLLLAGQADSPAARLRALAVLDRCPDREDIRRCRVRLAMNLGQLVTARRDLAALLETSPRNGELHDLLGQCEQAAGEEARAAECFTKAIRCAPAQLESYVRLTLLLRGPLRQPKRADKVMNDLVSANARSAEAYLARARYRQQYQSPAEAARDVDSARKLSPDHAEVLLASAAFASAEGKFTVARGYLQRGLELYPRRAAFYTQLGAVDQQAGRHADAVACLRRGLQVVAEADRNELRTNLLAVLIEGKEYAQAEETLALLKKAGPSPLLQLHEARLLVRKGQYRQAAALLQRLRPHLARQAEMAANVDLLLGECHGKLGDLDRQVSAYRSAVVLAPRSSVAHRELGAALLAQGRTAAAVSEYRQMMAASNAAADGWVLLGRALVLHNLALPPEKRDWAEVTEVLDRAARTAAGTAEVPILRAEVLMARQQPEQARVVLEEARARHPGEVAVWVALADLAERRGQPRGADAILETAQRHLGQRVELSLARLRCLTRRGGAELRQALPRYERELDKQPADQQRLLPALADAYLRLGEVAAAQRLWTRLADRQPENLAVRLLLCDVAVQTGKDSEAVRLVGEIRRIEGEEGTWWRYGEAARLLTRAARGDRTGLNRAVALLTEIARARPGWLRLTVLEAQVHDLQGRPEQALEKYQQAVEQGERQPAVAQRLVELLYARQRYREADRVLRQLHDAAAVPPGLAGLGSQVALHAQDAELAVVLARQSAADRPKDHRPQVWLGLSLWSLGRRREAETALRQALRLADDVPETWVSLVYFLAGTGQKAKAEVVVRQAEGKLSAAQAPLALAQCCQALGQLEQAEKHYNKALAARPGTPALWRSVAAFYLGLGQVAKAEPHLRKLIDPSSQAEAGDVAWARRNLAVAVASRGDYRQFRQALALLDRNRQPQQKDRVEDLHARAMVLATRPSQHRQAIGVLEEIAQRQPLAAVDLFLLLQLYEGLGEWRKADRCMERLLSADGENRLYLAHCIRGKLRRQETDLVVAWVERLERLHPGTWEAVEGKARLLQARGKGAEAVSLVEQFLAPGRNEPPAGATGLAAALLDELGQVDAAERLYRAEASRTGSPEGVLRLIAFLGRQKHWQEALEQCEQAWKRCPAEAVASLSVALVRQSRAATRDVKRVEGWLQAALEKAPGSAALLLALANLRDLQGRYDESETLYRRVHDRHPNNVLAMNNLAFLLALRGGKGKLGEARRLIDAAIEIFGPEAQLLDTRAVIHLEAGQSEQALKDLREAIAQNPSASYHFHRALAQRQGKSLKAAREAVQTARARGLTADSLHPLERPAYRRLLAELERK